MDIWSVLQIAENRWQLFCVDGENNAGPVLVEGTFEAVMAARRLLGEKSIEQIMEQGREIRASIESSYKRLTTLTAEYFAVRSR